MLTLSRFSGVVLKETHPKNHNHSIKLNMVQAAKSGLTAGKAFAAGKASLAVKASSAGKASSVDHTSPATPDHENPKQKGAPKKSGEVPEEDPSPDIRVISTKSIGEFDPKELLGLTVESYNRLDSPERLELCLSNKMLLCILGKADLWDTESGSVEPEICTDDALGQKLCTLPGHQLATVSRNKGKDNEGASPLKIIEVEFGEQNSKGWKVGRPGRPWDEKKMGPLHEATPDWQKHLVFGLRLDGMENVGWIHCVRKIWKSDWDCPHEITFYDVTMYIEEALDGGSRKAEDGATGDMVSM